MLGWMNTLVKPTTEYSKTSGGPSEVMSDAAKAELIARFKKEKRKPEEIRKKRKRGLDTADREDNNERPAPQSTQTITPEAGAGQEDGKATADNEAASLVATTTATEAGVGRRGKRVKSVKLRVR